MVLVLFREVIGKTPTMLRRQRMGLLAAVIFLVVAVVLALGTAWIIRSGTIERQISRLWSKHLPGSLTVTAVRVVDPDRMRIQDLELKLSGSAVLTCGQADVVGRVQSGQLSAIEVTRPAVFLQEATLPAIQELIQEIGALAGR